MSSATASARPPSSVGLENAEALYAYCYCEENVYRAIEQIEEMKKPGCQEVIHTFAVFMSSFERDPATTFPGAWLPFSRVQIVVDQRGTRMNWDYHVICVVQIIQHNEKEKGGGGQAEEEEKQEGEGSDDEKRRKTPPSLSHLYVADFDSALCNNNGSCGKLKRLVPFDEYCRVTFSVTSSETCKMRVIPGPRYLETFSSTRCHMLPVPLLRQWLADPQRRPLAPPREMLQEPPHPTHGPILVEHQHAESKKRFDLVDFINMSSSSGTSSFSKVFSLADFLKFGGGGMM